MFRRETRGFRRLEFSCSPNQLSGVPALNQPHILLDQWRAQFSLDEQTANQCSRGFECPEADTGSTSVQQQQQQDGELARRDDDISADDTPSSHCRPRELFSTQKRNAEKQENKSPEHTVCLTRLAELSKSWTKQAEAPPNGQVTQAVLPHPTPSQPFPPSSFSPPLPLPLPPSLPQLLACQPVRKHEARAQKKGCGGGGGGGVCVGGGGLCA
ncbi:uncharacterized protein LOC144050642 isoform X1 [Vanacampus margaritifer]